MPIKIQAVFSPMTGTPLNADTPLSRGRIAGEILLVLGVSLGASALYSIVNIIDLSTRSKPLGSQSTALNTSLSDRPTFDLIYQLLPIILDLVPVALVCYILWQVARPHLARVGIDFRKPGQDVGVGILLALGIGAAGIGVYLAGRALGITVNVSADSLGSYWWTVPVLLLSAARAALQEEVIVIGYLYARLHDLGWRKWTIILSTAALRGSYHLYQGFGGFAANFIMGLVFGWLFLRWKRAMPFIVAHTIMDTVAFVGYALLAGHVGWLPTP